MTEADVEWTIKRLIDRTSGRPTIVRRRALPPVDAYQRYEWIAYLTFLFQPRDDSGLPSSEDDDALRTIEMAELPKLEADGLGVLVAVVFGEGVTTFSSIREILEPFWREPNRSGMDQRDFVSAATSGRTQRGHSTEILSDSTAAQQQVAAEARPGWSLAADLGVSPALQHTCRSERMTT